MRAPLALSLAALLLTGCAKFPSRGSTDYTRLTFSYRMATAINPNYLYIIAIRPLTAAQYGVQDSYGPIPVTTIGTGSNNGFVDGRPTRYVFYNPAAPTYYEVRRFGTRTPTSDNTNPIDLNAVSTVGYALTGTNPLQADGTYSDTLAFTITTQDLVDDNADASTIVGIDFNILTMNLPATSLNNVGNRVMDALGDQTSQLTFNAYRRVRINTSQRYLNSQTTSTNDMEQAGDTFGPTTLPPVDIVDWELDVNPQ